MNKSAVIPAPIDTRDDVVIGGSSGLPTRRLAPPLDEADPDTILGKLAAIASRSTKGLPPELADKLQALADACRTNGPVIEHPSWCDPAYCFSEDEPDGTIAVGHHRVLLEEFDCDVHIPGMQPERLVTVIRFDNYLPDGSIESEGATMFLDIPRDGEFVGAQARRFARAVAVAGELVTGDELPAGCKRLRAPGYCNPD